MQTKMSIGHRLKVGARIIGAAVKAAVWNLRNIHLSPFLRGLSARWTARDYSQISDKAFRNPYVTRALELVASCLASVPLLVYYFEMKEGKQILREDPAHPLAKILKRPNHEQGRISFTQTLVYNFYLAGENFLHFPDTPLTGMNAGRPAELAFDEDGNPTGGIEILRPDRISEIVRDQESDRITGYRYTNRKGITKVIPAVRILHIKTFNPGRGWSGDDERGRPLLASAMQAVDLMDEFAEWNKTIFQEKGRIPLFFEYTGPGDIRDETLLKDLDRRMVKTWREKSRSGDPMLLNKDLKPQNHTVSPTDADGTQGNIQASRAIAVATGPDPALMGDSANKTYSNLETALKALYLLKVLPLLDWLLDELNARLMVRYEGDRFLGYDRDQIEALQEDMTAMYERILKATGRPFLSVDEGREELKFPATNNPANAEPWASFNMLPVSAIVGSPGQEGGEASETERELSRLADMSEAEFQAMIKRITANGTEDSVLS